MTFFGDVMPLIENAIKLILSNEPSFNFKLRSEVIISRDKVDERGVMHSTLVKEMLTPDTHPNRYK